MGIESLLQSRFVRGSEWRRWDLHVHTPESKLGNSFTGISWNTYVDALEHAAAAAGVSVIGVTDYMSIDGYSRLRKERASSRLSQVQLLIPNIEFRALPSTTDGKALNIHLLVDPSDEGHEEKIIRALSNLRVKYNGESYGCVRAQLIEYARAQDSTLASDESAYAFGIAQFKPSYDEILKWLTSERWLSSNSLVGVSNGKDGISGLPADGFSAIRDQILKNSHFVFSGNPNDRAYYLGKKPGVSVADILRMYGSLKPCLHGSDAHAVEDLFIPKEQRFCWIKADPTFEGLKQVLWEPETRIRIGASSPALSDRTRVITKLSFSNLSSWFNQDDLELNDGLVAVIGEKGSGKTAIADLVAFAAGERASPDSQSSFLVKGRLHLSGGEVSLTWGDGNITSGILPARPFDAAKPLVRYLSQDFVERLCSTDSEGRELQSAIEDVVFSHLGEASREGFSSFEELRKSRETASQSRQDAFRGDLAALHREVERLILALAQRPQKAALVIQAQQKSESLRKLLPEVELLADQAVLEQLKSQEELLASREAEVAKLNRRKRALETLIAGYLDIQSRTTRSIQELVDSARGISELAPELTSALYPSWDPNALEAIQATTSELNSTIDAIRGSESDLDDKTIEGLKASISRSREALSKDEINRNRLLDLQKQIAEQEGVAKRLAIEIDELDGKTARQLNARLAEREHVYANYFEALAADSKGLEELYAPMKKQLQSSGGENKFELSSGIHIDLRSWLDQSARFYDGRKPQASVKKDSIEKFVHDRLVPTWKTGDKAEISTAIHDFYELVSPSRFMQECATPSLKMIDLFDWIYSTDHVRISYKILYDGVELEYLSPGTRGIALLVLYLLMDEDDRRPLIIDQPEGNLDNASVFEQLVPYIRDAKEKRQIVLITHNPNLVVATDAEQVIVATASRLTTQSFPRMTYYSGSLEHHGIQENLGIREAVCTLLEGGEAAFREREVRYGIGLS